MLFLQVLISVEIVICIEFNGFIKNISRIIKQEKFIGDL